MIIDKCRDFHSFTKFFFAHPMNDGLFSLDFVLNNPYLFCAYDEKTGKLKAYANMYEQDGKLFISGASVRKNLPENVNFIIKICNACNQDVYADTDKKTARIVLNRAGFKKIGTNLYKRLKK